MDFGNSIQRTLLILIVTFAILFFISFIRSRIWNKRKKSFLKAVRICKNGNTINTVKYKMAGYKIIYEGKTDSGYVLEYRCKSVGNDYESEIFKFDDEFKLYHKSKLITKELNYHNESDTEVFLIEKGKYIKNSGSRMSSIFLSLLLLSILAYNTYNHYFLNGAFDFSNTPFDKQFDTKEAYIFECVHYLILVIAISASVTKLLLGTIFAFTDKSLFAYNHYYTHSIFKIIYNLDLLLIFIACLYTYALEFDFINLENHFAFRTFDEVKYRVLNLANHPSDNLFMLIKFISSLIVSIPLLIDVLRISIVSVLSGYIIYLSAILGPIFMLAYLGRNKDFYWFENFDSKYYRVIKRDNVSKAFGNFIYLVSIFIVVFGLYLAYGKYNLQFLNIIESTEYSMYVILYVGTNIYIGIIYSIYLARKRMVRKLEEQIRDSKISKKVTSIQNVERIA